MTHQEHLQGKNIQFFLYGVCLRISPFFRMFSEIYEIHHKNLLSECLQDIGSTIFSKRKLETICAKWIPILEDATPDMDDYNSELIPSLALDAIAATLTMLDYFLTRHEDLVQEVVSISMNSAEFINESPGEIRLPEWSSGLSAVSLEKNFINELKEISEGNELDFQKSLDGLLRKYSYL